MFDSFDLFFASIMTRMMDLFFLWQINHNDLHIADLQNLDVKLGTPIIHIDIHMVKLLY